MDTTTIETIISLASQQVSTHPGAPTEIEVRIKNLSTRVHRYELTVIGPAATWVTVAESHLTATDRGGEASTSIYFTAPADDSAPAGAIPFGIVAQSEVDGHAVCEEGVVEVAAAPGVAIVPLRTKVKARWKAAIPYEIINTGNDEARLALVGHSPAGELDCTFDPDVVTIAAGGAQIAHLRSKIRRPRVRGSVEAHQIEAACYGHPWGAAKPDPGTAPLPSDEHHRPAAPVVLNQLPIVSAMVIVIAMLVVALLALYIFWPRPHVSPEIGGPAKPAAPVVLLEEHDSITVSWLQTSGASSYEVSIGTQRKTIDANFGIFELPFDGLEPATEYTVTLTAIGVNGKAQPVQIQARTTITPTLSPPSAPAITPLQGAAGERFTITWTLLEGEEIEPGDTFTVFFNGQNKVVVTETSMYEYPAPAGEAETFEVRISRQRGAETSGLGEPASFNVTGDPPDAASEGGGGGEDVPAESFEAWLDFQILEGGFSTADSVARGLQSKLAAQLDDRAVFAIDSATFTWDADAAGDPRSLGPGFGIFVSGFTSLDEARAFCEAEDVIQILGETCTVGVLTTK